MKPLSIIPFLSICTVSAVSWAYPPYVNQRYGLPELPGSFANFECTDCHVHPSGGGACNPAAPDPQAPCFNPFGIEYRTTGWSAALGDLDADGDGITNADELNALGSAGFPASAEAAGCDMLSCATGASTACNDNVICDAILGVVPTNSYSFSFACTPGSVGTAAGVGVWGCTDTNECAVNPCGAGTCSEIPIGVWLAPGFTCACPAGFVAFNDTCVAADCGATDDCSSNSMCIENPAPNSFSCFCEAGFAGDGTTSGTGCGDIDECATNTDDCADVATCTNEIGGFTCTCPSGYSGDGTTCVDVNECSEGTDNCDENATCTNVVGLFECSCDAGFVGDGTTCTMELADMGPDAEVDMGSTEDVGVDVGESDMGMVGSDAGEEEFVEVVPTPYEAWQRPDYSGDSLSGDGCSAVGGGASWLAVLALFGLRRRR